MNYAVPTNKSMCGKKLEKKGLSQKVKDHQQFFRTHKFAVKVNKETDTMEVIVTER